MYKENYMVSNICAKILLNISNIYKKDNINKAKTKDIINYFCSLKEYISDNDLYVDGNNWRNKFDNIIKSLENIRDGKFNDLDIDYFISNVKFYVLHLCGVNEKESLIEYMKNIIYILDVYFDKYIKFLNFEYDGYDESFYVVYGDLEESLINIIKTIKQIYIKQDDDEEYKSFRDLEEYINNFLYLLQHDKFSRSLIPYMSTKNIVSFVSKFINKEG